LSTSSQLRTGGRGKEGVSLDPVTYQPKTFRSRYGLSSKEWANHAYERSILDVKKVKALMDLKGASALAGKKDRRKSFERDWGNGICLPKGSTSRSQAVVERRNPSRAPPFGGRLNIEQTNPKISLTRRENKPLAKRGELTFNWLENSGSGSRLHRWDLDLGAAARAAGDILGGLPPAGG